MKKFVQNMQLGTKSSSSDTLLEIRSDFLSVQTLIEKKFDIFYKEVELLVETCDNIIKKTFPADPIAIQDQITETFSYAYSAGALLAKAQRWLIVFETMFFVPKIQKLSETDRKKELDIKCLDQKFIVQRLKTIEEKLDKKISILQSLLKAEMARYTKEK